MKQANEPNMDIKKLYGQAVELQVSGDLKSAIFLYEKIISIDPNQFNVAFNMGAAFNGLGLLDKAISCFKKAAAISPGEAAPYYDIGTIYFRQNKLLEAILALEKAIEIKPDYAHAHNNLDVVLQKIGSSDVYKASYNRLLKNNKKIFDMGPQRIRIETSSACNLRCQHCPTGVNYHDAERSIMEMDTFNKIIDQMNKLKIVIDCVLYLGGEPLMNKNLSLMCRRVKEETPIIKTMFNSNAMLLSKKKCEELLESNIDQITISIDGRSPEENDRMRKGADYSIIINNVKRLKRYLPNVDMAIANTIIKRSGDPDLPQTPEFLVRDFPGFTIQTTYAMQWPGLDFSKSDIQNISIEKSTKKNFCYMPFKEMSIRPNGDVIMCCYDISGQHVMGNIHKTDLLTIWKSPAYKELRKNMLFNDYSRLPTVCAKCITYTGASPVIQTQ